MFKEDTLCLLIKNWWKYKPEDELYYKLLENPHWPFKQLADGYYYVVVQSDRAAYGMWFFVGSIIGHILCTYLLGYFTLTQTFFLICYLFCGWTLRGRIAWRELIISRRGRGSYMLRVLSNQEKLIQHELRNIYIRLTRKDDASGDPYFWLNLSGYELDDYRITRMTKAENALRIMGMRLAYRLGVNFFDWKDESEEHLIFHYKTYSKLPFHPQVQIVPKSREHSGRDLNEEGTDREKSDENQHHHHHHHKSKAFLSVPSRRGHGSSYGGEGGNEAVPPRQTKRSTQNALVDDARRKVKIEDKIGVKRI